MKTHDDIQKQSTKAPGISYKEFLESCPDQFAEWIDGEIIKLSPASDQHQEVSLFLSSLMNLYMEHKKTHIVRAAPFQMKLGEGLPGREPDLVVVRNEHKDRIKAQFLDGPADLAVEIISPDSRSRDRGEKYYEYEQGGVQEYWMIDPDRKKAEFYGRGSDGLFELIPISEEGIFESREVEGFRLDVNWLWQRPSPSVLAILRDWGII